MRKIKFNIKDRKILYIMLSIIIVCVFSLAIAYAALSTTLNVSGSTEVVASDFSLLVEKVYGNDAILDTMYEKQGITCEFLGNCNLYYNSHGVEVINDPIIEGTSIRDFKLSATMPGDSIFLLFKVTNNGTIPVSFSAITNSSPIVQSTINNESDVAWGNSNLRVGSRLYHLDGTTLVNEGEILCPGEVWLFNYVFQISSDATTIPSAALNVTNLNAEMFFVQEDVKSCVNS